jgi:hypothetical protein
MTSGEVYRSKAAAMEARGRADTTRAGKEHYAMLCMGYLRLAEQVDRRGQTEVIHGNALRYYWHRGARRLIHVLLQHTGGLRRNDVARH